MAKRRPGTRSDKEAIPDEPGDEDSVSPEERPRSKARRRRERFAKVELKRRRKRLRLVVMAVFIVVAVILVVALVLMNRPTEEPPIVVIETDKGTIEVELFMDECPKTAGNMKKLVEEGFYNGLQFHRIVNDPGFKIMQGGDPNGDGTGGPGYALDFEESAGRINHVRGSIAMARSQEKDSAGSQFYICGDAIPDLDGEYAVFGKVVAGMDVVDAIIRTPTDTNSKPTPPITMTKVYLKGS